jgi:hypothetical protein
MPYTYDPNAETRTIPLIAWEDQAHPMQNLDYLCDVHETNDHGDR